VAELYYLDSMVKRIREVRETVDGETPAAAAISLIVTAML